MPSSRRRDSDGYSARTRGSVGEFVEGDGGADAQRRAAALRDAAEFLDALDVHHALRACE